MSTMEVSRKHVKLLGESCTTEAPYFGAAFQCKLKPSGGASETISLASEPVAPTEPIQGGKLRRKVPRRKTRP